jgi:hypothetical protein
MEKVYIFCDEFGTSTLKQNDVKNITKFVYCSIIIKESQLKHARQVRDEISAKFLDGQKLKSSSKKLKNDEVRINCLNYLFQNLSFINHYLIVDKEKLDQDKGGLRFKGVFYKYFQKIFISQLTHSYTDFEISMHHTISQKYGDELKVYLANKVKDTLFENYHFLDDETEPLIQFADLLAGSFGKYFNKDFFTHGSDQILNILKLNFPKVDFFPFEKNIELKSVYSNNEVSKEIYNIVRTDALNLEKNTKDEVFQLVLEQLLSYQKIAPTVYLQTYELTNYAKYYFNKDISTDQLRLIIRDLRFEGIIIVSANNKSGYKLAVNQEDIYQYFNHYSKYILPMLKKIQIANDIFINRTVGEYNPLKDFDDLASLVNENKLKLKTNN